MQSDIRFLTLHEVLRLHEIAIQNYGGYPGVRDLGLVESALAGPAQTWAGEYLFQSVPDMAAALWYSLAKNHGFVDGNKRVSLLAADAFLQFNGLLLTLSSSEVEALTLNIAIGECSREEVAQVIRENTAAL